MNLKHLRSLEWEAIAGIVAATAAIVMHFLHLIEVDILITIAVLLIALLFIRDLRQERATEQAYASIEESRAKLTAIQRDLLPPDAVLIGPTELRAASERFAVHAKGDMVWFHVCLSMFRPQPLFDTLLRPAVENPHVTSIQFILDDRQKDMWDSDVLPKLEACKGKDKVAAPCWTTITESVSVIIANIGAKGEAEALLSFWGEPFMAHTTERDVPRYIFHVQGHSELVARLVELTRGYRFTP